MINNISNTVPKYNTVFKNKLLNLKNNPTTFGSSAAKLGKTVSKPDFIKSAGLFFRKKTAALLNKGIDQTGSNVINYGSKAIITPMIILGAGRAIKEKKESIKASALMNSIQGVLTLASATIISAATNKGLNKAAKKGKLGNFIDPELGKFFNPITETGKKHLSKLKSIATIGITIAAIPVTSELLNRILPKLINKRKEPEINPYVSSVFSTFGSNENIFEKKLKIESEKDD